jgi:endonuclease-3
VPPGRRAQGFSSCFPLLASCFLIYNEGMPTTKKYISNEQSTRIRDILRGLGRGYPNAQCALRHSSRLELLVATILSAQCTDERVNIVTQTLFRKYRTPEDYVNVPPEELEADIRPTGFFRNKTRSIQGACKVILEKFGGAVPNTMEGLLQLPGVARKTANVVLGVAFGKAEGIVVDTHVLRVSQRLDLTRADTPENIERDLMQIVPRKRWISFSHEMILHGRNTCKARKPLCPLCPVGKLCYSKDKVI